MMLLIAFSVLFIYLLIELDSNLILFIYDRLYKNKRNLKNKVVWIVGSSKGIGEEIAYRFAELNCRLILTSRSKEQLIEVKKKCLLKSKKLKEEDILILNYDITDFEKNKENFQEILNYFGVVDILVNNAGFFDLVKFNEIDEKYHKDIFDLNFFANVFLTKIVTKHWIDNKLPGKVLVTSSLAVITTIPYFQIYSATKAALNAYYKIIAIELKQFNVDICITDPGPIKTSLLEENFLQRQKFNFVNSLFVLTPKRCSELMLTSLANNLTETWIAKPFMIFVSYFVNFFPTPIIFILIILSKLWSKLIKF